MLSPTAKPLAWIPHKGAISEKISAQPPDSHTTKPQSEPNLSSLYKYHKCVYKPIRLSVSFIYLYYLRPLLFYHYAIACVILPRSDIVGVISFSIPIMEHPPFGCKFAILIVLTTIDQRIRSRWVDRVDTVGICTKTIKLPYRFIWLEHFFKQFFTFPDVSSVS